MREWFSQLPSKIVEFWKKYKETEGVILLGIGGSSGCCDRIGCNFKPDFICGIVHL